MYMDARERRNVKRAMRLIGKDFNLPEWKVPQFLQQFIDHSWARAEVDPAHKALLDQYFPGGKPTPEEYILLLGRAEERGEKLPYFFVD